MRAPRSKRAVSVSDIAVHVLITGRVQGVGYRYAAAEYAHELELSGWVQNLPDGRVEALLCGEEEIVRTMLGWMKEGPELARVDDISVAPSTEVGPQPFQVRR